MFDGDELIVSGQKVWTSHADKSDWIFCLVRTNPDVVKQAGISFVLIDMRTPGIEVRPLVDMTGNANFNETFFTDVRVPKGQIVGARGQGWQVANAVLGFERDSLGDPNAMLSRLNRLIALMQEETIGGTPVDVLTFFADTPRALATDGTTIYVPAFRSRKHGASTHAALVRWSRCSCSASLRASRFSRRAAPVA